MKKFKKNPGQTGSLLSSFSKKRTKQVLFITNIVVVFFLFFAFLLNFVSANDIRESNDFIPQVANIVSNSDEIAETINLSVENDFYKRLKILENPTPLSFINNNSDIDENAEDSQFVRISDSFYAKIPSYDFLVTYITSKINNDVIINIETNENKESFVTNVASQINSRYTELLDQLIKADDERNNDYLVLTNIFLILLFIFLGLLIFNIFVTRENKKLIIIALGSTTLCCIAASFILFFGFRIYSISNNYNIDIEKTDEVSFSLEDLGIKFVDLPQYPEGGEIMGKIDINQLNIHHDIIEGLNDENLQKSVVHDTISVRPGQKGVVLIAGHNESTMNGLTREGFYTPDFGKIHELKEGELFNIKTSYGEFTYKVTASYVQKYYEFPLAKKISNYSDRGVILYSCWPIFSAQTDDRSFIEATQISGPIANE